MLKPHKGESEGPLDAKDWLVRSVWRRNHPLTLTIDKQVEIFKHGDTNEHLLAEHQSIADSCASKHFNLNPFSGVYFFHSSISIFCVSMSQAYEAELVCNKRRNRETCRSGINKGLRCIGTYLLSRKMSQPSHHDFPGVT